MELQRKQYQKLLEWKQSSQGSTAMLIEGARRVGKMLFCSLEGSAGSA